jgi:PKD repeat protein
MLLRLSLILPWLTTALSCKHQNPTGLDALGCGMVCHAEASPTSGTAPLTVQFKGWTSGPSSYPYSTGWRFGDGATDYHEDPTHVYTEPGTYTVEHSVTDHNGCHCSSTLTIHVGAMPPPPPGSAALSQRAGRD